MATRQWHRSGLLNSLDELCGKAALGALLLVGLVLVLRVATGYRPGQAVAHDDVTGPVLAITLASFVLVPMLALASAASAAIVFGGEAAARQPSRSAVLRGIALVGAAMIVLALAYGYDAVVIPAIT